MSKQGFTLLVALVAIPWANEMIQPGEAFMCPEIARGSLFARRQAREATRKESLQFFLEAEPKSEELAAKLEELGLDATGNKGERTARLTTYIETLEEPEAR
jgi:hypothetical protein